MSLSNFKIWDTENAKNFKVFSANMQISLVYLKVGVPYAIEIPKYDKAILFIKNLIKRGSIYQKLNKNAIYE